MSVQRYVRAEYAQDANGLPIPPAAGLTLISNGADGAVWASGSGSGAAPANVSIYVDSVSGDDSNSGSLLAPLATLDAAFIRVENSGWTISAQIWLQPGNYPLPTGRALRGDAGPGRKSTPVTVTGVGRSVLTTATVGTVTTVGGHLVIGGFAAPAAAEGQKLTFLTGALTGTSVPVSVLDSFTVTTPVSLFPTPAPGDLFQIERATATVVFDQIAVVGGDIKFRDVDIALVPGTLGIHDASLSLEWVHMFNQIPGPAPPAVAIAVRHGSIKSENATIGSHSGSSALGMNLTDRSSLVSNNSIMSGCGTIVIASVVLFEYVRVFDCFILVDGTTWEALGCRFDQPYMLVQMSRMILANCDIAGSIGDGISTIMSDLYFGGVTSSAANNGLGLRLLQGGKMQTYSGGVSVTGSAGDVQIGNRPVTTWAELFAGDVPRNDFTLPNSMLAGVGIQ